MSALSAELVRTRRTASNRLWLFGLALCLIQGAGSLLVGTRAVTRWEQVLLWQVLFVTALNAPLAGLLVGLTFQRERAARGGGTAWRPTSRAVTLVGRFAVLALQMLALDVASTLPMVLAGWAHGLADPPWHVLIGLPLALFGSTLGFLAVAMIVAERAGLFATVGLGLIWQIAGTLTATKDGAMLQPWTWNVRPGLRLLGVEANGVPAGPTSIVHQISLVSPVVASVLLAGAALAVAVWLPTELGLPRRTAGRSARVLAPASSTASSPAGSLSGLNPVIRGRAHPLRAMALSLARTGLGWLLVATAAAFVGTVVLWRDASYLTGLLAFLVIPIGACLLACVVHTAQTPVLRSLLIRASSARICASLWAVCLGVLSMVVGIAALALALTGGSDVGRTAVVAWCVGAAGIAINLWLCTRWSIAVALGVTLLGWLSGLVFDGSVLADSPLWLAGPAGWTASADTWPRVLIAVVCSLATAAVCWWGWVRAVQRAAVRTS